MREKKLADTNNRVKPLSGIEYHGIAGASADCEAAVINLFQCGRSPKRAYVLTEANKHALLLIDDIGDQIAIKSGFASSYHGTGPRAFSFVLALLYQSGVAIEEILVDAALIDTNRDLKRIIETAPRRPSRWAEYIFEDHFADAAGGKLWRNFPFVVPFAIIDPRMVDLARDFQSKPDEKLMTGYRRLEDILRERTGVREHGTKLFSTVFLGKNRRLTWKVDDEAEQTGRANLFSAAFMAFRNPRAHQERPSNIDEQLSQFLVLNQLFRLEALAVAELSGPNNGGHRAANDTIAETDVNAKKRPTKG